MGWIQRFAIPLVFFVLQSTLFLGGNARKRPESNTVSSEELFSLVTDDMSRALCLSPRQRDDMLTLGETMKASMERIAQTGKSSKHMNEALNTAFASSLADIAVSEEGWGSIDEKTDAIINAVNTALIKTTGKTNTVFLNEIQQLISMFYQAHMKDEGGASAATATRASAGAGGSGGDAGDDGSGGGFEGDEVIGGSRRGAGANSGDGSGSGGTGRGGRRRYGSGYGAGAGEDAGAVGAGGSGGYAGDDGSGGYGADESVAGSGRGAGAGSSSGSGSGGAGRGGRRRYGSGSGAGTGEDGGAGAGTSDRYASDAGNDGYGGDDGAGGSERGAGVGSGSGTGSGVARRGGRRGGRGGSGSVLGAGADAEAGSGTVDGGEYGGDDGLGESEGGAGGDARTRAGGAGRGGSRVFRNGYGSGAGAITGGTGGHRGRGGRNGRGTSAAAASAGGFGNTGHGNRGRYGGGAGSVSASTEALVSNTISQLGSSDSSARISYAVSTLASNGGPDVDSLSNVLGNLISSISASKPGLSVCEVLIQVFLEVISSFVQMLSTAQIGEINPDASSDYAALTRTALGNAIHA